ncbi:MULTISPECIES: CGNR zinc finger domain-containing protein [Micromonospora]|uniref:CGNR zinc finger domain-containing protein n=1 Tax=Micromonospora TaxID=1873 RepID=UPI001B37DBBC|nr:ABATE domain-containing protein [Micromonospora sp. M61]MBQ0980778.1 ABATE domain-containing protein [Micromonospora sp. M61]WTI22548.1 ABATE domain-containing protein [Micromonospora zamorensis]
MRFEFIADRPVLDFLPTLAERGHTDIEQLTTPQDFADWAVQAGVVEQPPHVDDAALRQAKDLREAMFRLVRALIDGTDAAPADRELVNDAAAGPLPELRLDVDGVHRTGDTDAVLTVLARDCLELHASDDRHALRWCADEHCTRAFVDRSRGSRRRWCGMRGCGDRAKAAAYRRRRRTSAP